MKTVKDYKKYIFQLLTDEKFNDALEIIEEKRVKNKNKSFFYSMYGIAHLYMGYMFEAKMYINKALEMNAQDPDALNALAYIYLKDLNIDEAIRLYLKILDFYPELKHVQRNLNRFKGKTDPDQLISQLDPEQYLNPGVLPLKSYQKLTLYIFTGMLIFVIIFIMKDITLNNKDDMPVTYREHFKNILYIQEHEKEHLKQNIKDSSDSSYVALNKLLLSNASLEEKIRVEHLKRRFISNLSSIISLNLEKLISIEKQPLLYVNIVYKFEGIISKKNLQRDKQLLTILFKGREVLIQITKNHPHFNSKLNRGENKLFFVKVIPIKHKSDTIFFELIDVK